MMEQKHSTETLQRLNRALRLLVSCNKAIFHAKDEPKLLSEICRQIVEVGGYLMAWVGYAEHDREQRILPVAYHGYEQGYLENLNLTWADRERGRGPTGTAIRTGRSQINHDFRSNPALALWRESALSRGYQSNIAIPLLNDGAVLGALTIYSDQPHAFTAEEASLLEELAHDMTMGMLMQRTHAETARLRNDIQQAEAALHSSQEQYRLLFESSRDALMTLGPPTWKFTDANQATLDLFGVSSKAEFIQLGPWDVSPERQPSGNLSSEEAQQRIARAMRDGSNFFEWQHQRLNGKPFAADVLLTRMQVGENVFLQATVRDISQRKQVELEFNDREYLLSESQRMAQIGSWSWEISQNQVKWTDETYRIYGVRKGEFQPHVASLLSLLHTDDQPLMQEWLRACAAGKKPSPLIFRSIHPDGSTRTLLGQGDLHYDELGTPLRMLGTVQDITERYRIEQALQESERRYRSFAEKLPLGVVITHNGRIKYVNQALTEAIGYSLAEMLEQPFLPFVYEEDRAWLMELHVRRMKGEHVSPHYTFRVKRRDGQIRLWENHASSTEWMGELSSLGIVTDITERAELEEALRNSLHQLEEKEKSKSRFLAAAGHDMRQPLAAANLFIDALKFTELTPDQDRIVQRLEQSMQTFNGLLESLLNISKLDAGIITPKLSAISIAELFSWLEQNFAPLAAEKKLELRLHFPLHATLAVQSDIGLLKSVLMNLVSNAIKFTRQGTIMISARPHDNAVLFQIWDTGIGFEAEHAERIFDEFYQVSNPQRDIKHGLGLGLSIVKRAALLLGSRITCRSTPGRGSVFSFSLPYYHDTKPVTAQDNTPQHDDEDCAMFVWGKHIVVVEDNLMIAEALSDWLERIGAEVSCFHNAQSALEQPGIEDADCYIVDYMLGNTHNGIQLLREIQQRRGNSPCAALMTGDTSPAFIQASRDCEWPVLHKPVDMLSLISSLMGQEDRISRQHE